jgi:Glycosyl transferase family 11
MSQLRCIIQVMGGLGNQLFQYALGRSLEIERDADVRYDLAMYNMPGERELSLLKYRTSVRAVSEFDKFTMRLSMGRTLGRIAPLLNLASAGWRVYNDPRNGCDSAVRDLHGRWYLRGWWQSPAYFDSIRATLLKELQPSETLTGTNLDMSRRIEQSNSVCVHVRRGDYVSSPVYSRILKTQTAEYYLAAMAEIRQRIADAKFFVFSDDAEWTQQHIQMDAPIVHVHHNGPKQDYLDLHLMSCCRHFITANSTFSWWGAWLSGHEGKIVIVPDVWGATGDGPPTGLIPKDWQLGPALQSADLPA